MHTDRPPEQSSSKQDVLHPAFLLAIAAAIGIYLIVTAPVISQDGVTFVQFARNLKISPIETMQQENQHPGYPYLILAARGIAQVFCEGNALSVWIYSAQAVTLLFRLLAIVAMYFLGKLFVGPKPAFVAALLLIVLPVPAGYGSDALSDWPALFFVVTALLCSMQGAAKDKWWLFGLAGVFAGAGYLVRPECSQIVIYGLLWLTLQLFGPKRNMSRPRTVLATAALCIGFCALAAPYMNFKGAAFPKKGVGEFASKTLVTDEHNTRLREDWDESYTAEVVPAKIAEGVLTMLGNIGDTVMWFFLPAMVIGFCDYLRQRRDSWRDPKCFFVPVLLAFNAILLIWLYVRHGYMSRRHTLLMVVILAFYIRPGLQVLGALLGALICPNPQAPRTADDYRNFFYTVLLIVGVSLCIPKLLKPLHYDKTYIRLASRWLVENTEPQAVIAAYDPRIGFYAERKEVPFDERNTAQEVRYVVVREGGRETMDGQFSRVLASIDDGEGKAIVHVYGRPE